MGVSPSIRQLESVCLSCHPKVITSESHDNFYFMWYVCLDDNGDDDDGGDAGDNDDDHDADYHHGFKGRGDELPRRNQLLYKDKVTMEQVARTETMFSAL